MLLKIINVFAFILMVVVNYMANALPINGKTTGELSAQFPNLFVPAGITFSIWGIIYLLLLAFLVFQFTGESKSWVNTIGWSFAISCILNALWIVAWHYEQLPLSLMIMLGLLIVLVYINGVVINASMGLTKIAFGLYLGWICVATIANATALLVHYNWAGWGISQEAWAIIMIAASVVISVFALTRLQNPFLGIALIWAFAGIMIKRFDDYTSIVIAAGAAIIVVGVFMVLALQKKVFL